MKQGSLPLLVAFPEKTYFQQFALAINAYGMAFIHFVKSLGFGYFPNTFFKKSTSICS